MCKKVLFLLFLFFANFLFSQNIESEKWADSIISNMSPEERISQLLMVAAYSNKDESHTRYISNLIQNYKIGGLMFLQGGPVRQAKLTNYYQSVSETPLMIALDAEWGVAMRLHLFRNGAAKFIWGHRVDVDCFSLPLGGRSGIPVFLVSCMLWMTTKQRFSI